KRAAALLLEDTRTTRFKAARGPRVKPGGAVRLRAREARQVYRRSGRPGGHSEGQNTRSHPELGRENPQRQWYCALRRGRVGPRQACQTAGSPGEHSAPLGERRPQACPGGAPPKTPQIVDPRPLTRGGAAR